MTAKDWTPSQSGSRCPHQKFDIIKDSYSRSCRSADGHSPGRVQRPTDCGASDWHLHQFEIGGLRYRDLDMLNQDRFEGDAQAFDASEVRCATSISGTTTARPSSTCTTSATTGGTRADREAARRQVGTLDGDLHRGRTLMSARGCRRAARLRRVPARAAEPRARRDRGAEAPQALERRQVRSGAI